MLMRNLNQTEGLRNGTRLIVTHLGSRSVRDKVVAIWLKTKAILVIPSSGASILV